MKYLQHFSPIEILLHTNTFSISASFLKNRSIIVARSLFFSVSISPYVKISLPIFIWDYKFF